MSRQEALKQAARHLEKAAAVSRYTDQSAFHLKLAKGYISLAAEMSRDPVMSGP